MRVSRPLAARHDPSFRRRSMPCLDGAHRMGLRGRAFVERELSLERMVEAHEALYRRALGPQSIAPEVGSSSRAAL